MSVTTERRTAQGKTEAADCFEVAAQRCADLFRPHGRFAHGYVLGKLLRDPVYRQLVERAPFLEPVVDLGCGRGQTGLLLSILFPDLRVTGYDWDAEKLGRAREAALRLDANEQLSFEAGDLRTLTYPRAKTILMLDVLHYNPIETQDEMLRRACASLLPGGRLFVREVDAHAGWRARITIWQEQLGCLTGLNRGSTLRFRSAESIEEVLHSCKLATRRVSSWKGTPLANVLIEATGDR